MKTIVFIFYLFLVLAQSSARSQTMRHALPHPIPKNENYLFYLHGAVVTAFGDSATNQTYPEWGPYEYLNILDSLTKKGFNVISERRLPQVDDSIYILKVARQIDTLLRNGVPPKQILVVGASAGSDIALGVSARLANPGLNFVIMGGCWPNSYRSYLQKRITGRFLSIIESSDPHGTCSGIFENRKEVTLFREIKLNTGLSHGFLYRGYSFWIDPAVNWILNK